MIYILPPTVKVLGMLVCLSEKFKLITFILDNMLTSINKIVLVQKDISGNRLGL